MTDFSQDAGRHDSGEADMGVQMFSGLDAVDHAPHRRLSGHCPDGDAPSNSSLVAWTCQADINCD